MILVEEVCWISRRIPLFSVHMKALPSFSPSEMPMSFPPFTALAIIASLMLVSLRREREMEREGERERERERERAKERERERAREPKSLFLSLIPYTSLVFYIGGCVCLHVLYTIN